MGLHQNIHFDTAPIKPWNKNNKNRFIAFNFVLEAVWNLFQLFTKNVFEDFYLFL